MRLTLHSLAIVFNVVMNAIGNAVNIVLTDGSEQVREKLLFITNRINSCISFAEKIGGKSLKKIVERKYSLDIGLNLCLTQR